MFLKVTIDHRLLFILPSGLVYDMTRNYNLVFVTFGVLQVLILLCYVTSLLLHWRLRRRCKTPDGCTTIENDNIQSVL